MRVSTAKMAVAQHRSTARMAVAQHRSTARMAVAQHKPMGITSFVGDGIERYCSSA